MNDLEYIADMIAGEANTCCYRSDSYRDDIYKMALVGLRNAVLAEREACAKVCEEYHRKAREDLIVSAQPFEDCAAAIRGRSK